MTLLRDSGYRGWPYIHTDFALSAVTFYWWAKTPTGRQSIHWQAYTFYRLRSTGKLRRGDDGYLHSVVLPSRHYGQSTEELADQARQMEGAILPRLGRRYAWQGPFLYVDPGSVPTVETNTFRFREPATSDGIQLGYTAIPRNGDLQLALVQTIAKKVLGEREVTA